MTKREFFELLEKLSTNKWKITLTNKGNLLLALISEDKFNYSPVQAVVYEISGTLENTTDGCNNILNIAPSTFEQLLRAEKRDIKTPAGRHSQGIMKTRVKMLETLKKFFPEDSSNLYSSRMSWESEITNLRRYIK